MSYREAPRPLYLLRSCKKHSFSQTRAYKRPAAAPKAVLDIKHIARNPGLYQQNCIARKYEAQKDHSWDIVALDRRRKQLHFQSQSPRDANAEARRKVEQLKWRERQAGRQETSNSAEMEELLVQAQKARENLTAFEEEWNGLETKLDELAWGMPNLSSVHTPDGTDPQVIDTWGEKGSKGKSHVDIGAELDMLDFAGAANTTGWGWYFLKNDGAMLEQALIQYTLHLLRKRGWTVVSPPSVIYEHIAAGCGFQPRDQNGETQIYKLEQAERDAAKPPRVLAGTAEIPLAGMYAGQKLSWKDLPIKVVAASRCYRAESGSSGSLTKGLYRVHEFTKVEMFAWTAPDDHGEENFSSESGRSYSAEVFDEMVEIQREILRSLNLPHRVLEMPSAELGASATRKIDIEAFFPSRTEHDDGWGEVTSASICTDYQARRLATRLKQENRSLSFPHTVNGTAMAVPRVLAAVMENGWEEETKTVKIPEVLKPWM